LIAFLGADQRAGITQAVEVIRRKLRNRYGGSTNSNAGHTMPTLSKSWPLSSILLAAFGAALLVMGFYFMVLRPTFLPEDLRYMGVTLAQVSAAVPRLANWLNRVFTVLGGYVLASGVLTITLAATSFRTYQWTAGIGAFIAGAVSIGWMVVINFAIDSDFKWILLAIALLWISSIVLFWFEQRSIQRH
jgi:hypothetical protein